jgi:2-C-methyl-D-erythritol 2,4-cyclodiphosphate synthase
MNGVRIGNGIDVHRFDMSEAENSSIILGGVTIPHQFRLLAHSDGDVLTHALMDAMLGALAMGDIGTHFPDTDERYRGISSMELLEIVRHLIIEKGWQIGNADMTIVAQAPKIAPHVAAICTSLSRALSVRQDQISVKATTTEKLGFTGRCEGIAVYATVLLVSA